MPTKDGPRMNEDIESSEVRLILEDGNNIGLIKVEVAAGLADEAGMDLVEVSPGQTPVCKIMDYGRAKFEAQKKAAKARKKQKTVDIKELKLRPGIEEHDYQVKMRNMIRFIDSGDKVKLTIRFRGREMAHPENGMKLLNRVRDEFVEAIKVEMNPKMEGRMMTMIVAPANSK